MSRNQINQNVEHFNTNESESNYESEYIKMNKEKENKNKNDPLINTKINTDKNIYELKNENQNYKNVNSESERFNLATDLENNNNNQIEINDNKNKEINEENDISNLSDLTKNKIENITQSQINKSLKKRLIYKQKDISIFKLLFHFSEKIDYLFMLIGTIGSIGVGAGIPVLSYLSGDMFSEIGDTGDWQNNIYNLDILYVVNLKKDINDTMMKIIKRYLWAGLIMFICSMMSYAFWSYLGMKQVYCMKKKYLEIKNV